MTPAINNFPASVQCDKLKAPLKNHVLAVNCNADSNHNDTPVKGHISLSLDALHELDELVKHSRKLVLDGRHLTLASVVGSSRYEVHPTVDPSTFDKIDATVKFLAAKLDTAIYGVTTGFGGSADTRTDTPMALQMAFLEHQISGILPLAKTTSGQGQYVTNPMDNVMPEVITRGAILIRVNSLVRGHSAVRLTVLESLIKLLEKNLTPMVPLRGSISASGDLMPLSYVAAAICGHPAVRVIDRSSPTGEILILPASQALAKHHITPLTLGPKEGLGISNGTAFSASAACLAVHDAHMLALLSQVLTALSTEAMLGQVGNFHKFVHDVCRPHPGQVEVAQNIRFMLKGSRLAVEKDSEHFVTLEKNKAILRQDRYPLRTSAQWIGPQVEELVQVSQTLLREINCSTDNPLVDLEEGIIHNGGNFQAKAITNAMEKTRSVLESIGKICFAQATELMNCSMNKGLPSCLAGDEPSTNYHTKGLDINIAAYASELGFLASPVASHVQSAEQHNQAVNSLALVSARYTLQAIEVLSMLLSSHLYVACMAVDLRVIETVFQQQLVSLLPSLMTTHFKSPPLESVNQLMSELTQRFEGTATLDYDARFLDAYKHSSHVLLQTQIDMNELQSWPTYAASESSALYLKTRQLHFESTSGAEPWLSDTNKHFYRFLRQRLGIKPRRGDVKCGQHIGSITEDVSCVYESLRSGELFKLFLDLDLENN